MNYLRFFENNKEYDIKDEKNIDFKQVENYFKDETNKTNNKYNGFTSTDDFKNKSQIDNAFAKALEYTAEIKQQNMSLNEIMTKFRNEIPRFKVVYDRTRKNFIKNNQMTIKNINDSALLKNFIKGMVIIDEDKLKLEALTFWNKINDIKLGFITAAAFWATAWFGGISIPCSYHYCSNMCCNCRRNKYLYNN